jgi:hypothetical protein
VIEVQLTASDFQLELYVDGYEFPEFDTGRDANPLACEIEIDLRRRLDLHAAHSPLIHDTPEQFAAIVKAFPVRGDITAD